MKTVLALVAFMFLGAGCGSVELRDDAEERLVAAAEVIRQRLGAGDLAALTDQIPDDLFPGGVEPPAFFAESVDRVIELAQNIEFDPPGTIYPVGYRHVCVLNYKSSFNGTLMTASYIAVSSYGGRTWGFIGGSTAGVAALRMNAPELLDAIEDEIQPFDLTSRTP